MGIHSPAGAGQYQADEDCEKQCLARTCTIPAWREFAVGRIGDILTFRMAKRGRTASIDTTAAQLFHERSLGSCWAMVSLVNEAPRGV